MHNNNVLTAEQPSATCIRANRYIVVQCGVTDNDYKQKNPASPMLGDPGMNFSRKQSALIDTPNVFFKIKLPELRCIREVCSLSLQAGLPARGSPY